MANVLPFVKSVEHNTIWRNFVPFSRPTSGNVIILAMVKFVVSNN